MKKPSREIILSIVMFIFAIIVVSALINVMIIRFGSDGCQMRGKTPQYWEHPVPDGVYEVNVYVDLNEDLEFTGNSLSFPMCPSYGGQLHGTWNIAQNVTLPDELEMFVEERIIDAYWDGTYAERSGGTGKLYKHYVYVYGNVTVTHGWILATLENDVIVKLEAGG